METISGSFITFLLNAAWQIPVIAGVAALACRLMRTGPAAHRHFVWVAALAASLLLPAASMRTGADSVTLRAAVPDANAAISQSATPAAATRSAGPAAGAGSRTISYAPAIGSVFLGLYLVFLLAQAVRLLRVWVQTERLRGEAAPHPLPERVENVWRRCQASFGLYDVELLSSPGVSSPVTAGAWRKTIILPQAMLAETSRDVLTTAIGHEMAHLARRDFAMRVVYEIACLPISFHPALLLIRRGIEQTREMACDELVTRKLLDAGVYARSIMTIAAAVSAVARPGYTLGVFDGDILEQRIRRLVERPAANLKRARLLLATGLGALALCVAIAGGLAISARAQGGPAQAELKQGADALNHGDIAEAVQHFQNAVRLEPSNMRPKLFLASALTREFTAGSAEAVDAFAGARQLYTDVLASDAANRQALEGMIAVAIYTKQFSEARDWVLKLIAQDPKNESAYYSAGFLDWSVTYPSYAEARAQAGMKPQDQGIIPDAAARQRLRDQYGPQLEDGFRMLQIALQLKPDDDSAMAYMNLLYRIKAGIVDSDAESKDLVKTADDWVGRALAAKKQHARNPQPPPVNAEGDAPGPGNPQAVFAPPPPPPPPPGFAGDLGQPASRLALSAKNPREVVGMYWQVADPSDSPAKVLVGVLKQKGFAVRTLTGPDRQVRVMVGPFHDRSSLSQGKEALDAAGVQVIREW